MSQRIMVVTTYWHDEFNTWVIEDPAVGLAQEPLVEGAPEIMNELVAEIPDARSGVRLLFSIAPFPGYQQKLTRLREKLGGWWYTTAEPQRECWIGPAMFQYFDEAPAEIYVKAEPKDKG